MANVPNSVNNTQLKINLYCFVTPFPKIDQDWIFYTYFNGDIVISIRGIYNWALSIKCQRKYFPEISFPMFVLLYLP